MSATRSQHGISSIGSRNVSTGAVLLGLSEGRATDENERAAADREAGPQSRQSCRLVDPSFVKKCAVATAKSEPECAVRSEMNNRVQPRNFCRIND